MEPIQAYGHRPGVEPPFHPAAPPAQPEPSRSLLTVAVELFDRWPLLAPAVFVFVLISVMLVASAGRVDDESRRPANPLDDVLAAVGPAGGQAAAGGDPSELAAVVTTTVPTTTTTESTTTTVDPLAGYPTPGSDVVEVENGRPGFFFDRPSPGVWINVLDNDLPGDAPLDPASLEIVSQPAHAAQLSIEGGRIGYRPADDYVGSDSFEYLVCNVNDLCSIGSIQVNVVD